MNIGERLSECFNVKIGVHKGYVMSPCLFKVLVCYTDRVIREVKVRITGMGVRVQHTHLR